MTHILMDFQFGSPVIDIVPCINIHEWRNNYYSLVLKMAPWFLLANLCDGFTQEHEQIQSKAKTQ